MSWGSLPQDLIGLIFQCLKELPDVYRCLAVCTLWRFAARRRSVVATMPWLLIKHSCSDKELHFITRVPAKDSNMISIPLPSDHVFRIKRRPDGSIDRYKTRLVAKDFQQRPGLDYNGFNKLVVMVCSSYNGWLLLASKKLTSKSEDNYNTNMYLYNPISKVLVHLPVPLPSSLRGHHPLKLITSTSPTDPNCTICVLPGGRVYSGESYVLTFCKPGDKTNKVWNTLRKPYLDLYSLSFEDIIFYRGQFCTIHDDDLYFVNDGNIINSSTSTGLVWSRMKLTRKKVAETRRGQLIHTFYLVESKIGELLMVERVVQLLSRRSESFCVFKLNWSNKEWKEVSGFGGDGHQGQGQGQALFLAWNDSTFVSVEDKENEEYKPNCIYFFDESWKGGIVSCGVYDLRNHTIEPFHPPSQITHVKATFGQWFRPAAL